MGVIPVLAVVFAAVANAAGSAIIKYATTYRAAAGSKPAVFYALFVGALALFGGSFPFYAYGLSKMKLSVAQPVFSVGTYITVAIVALVFFKEPYSLLKVVGLVVIVIGIFLVANG